MDYPIRFADQLRQQLRALRKARGLSQAALGARIGVTQTRIAEIEARPGVVGVEQLLRMLSELGAELVVRDDVPQAPTEPRPAPAAREPPPRPTAPGPAPAVRAKPPRQAAPAASPPRFRLPGAKGSW
ncbi:MAG TPA: helix-turn-helix domain-containing protein [Burkholderiaceae bacterium]